ncbi:MAG: hypothetical protein B6U88_01360 [Candidatus Aenigmarchaeota archaeon ex4484_56]|nr:MAG: hypothetical protein B6U88_01360 [Candidatus Aenigmarchaeota archaeon ex4484_56]
MDISEEAKKLDIKGVIITSIISAFAFIVALFWRDFIQELIDYFVPHEEGIFYKFIAALIVTIIAVIVIYILSK